MLLALYQPNFWQEAKGTRKQTKGNLIKRLFLMVLAELEEANKAQDLGLAGVGDITIPRLESQGKNQLPHPVQWR